MNSLLHLKEGAFAERLTDKAITKVIAQESKDDELKFFVFAINADTKTTYVMRHGRSDALRTWRLDNLARFLKLHVSPNRNFYQKVKKKIHVVSVCLYKS